MTVRASDFPPPFDAAEFVGGPGIPPPPRRRNHGSVVFSLSQLGRGLGEGAEEGGAMILPETSAEKRLVSHGRVVGIRTGDKGKNREGEPMGNFEPGADLVPTLTLPPPAPPTPLTR